MHSFFVQKKTLLIEMVVLIAFLGGVYYLYTNVASSTVTTTPAINQSLLGQNFVMFLKAVQDDKISFKDITFLDSPLVSQLIDHSETILPNDTRGRVDPFVPYASSRPLR